MFRPSQTRQLTQVQMTEVCNKCRRQRWDGGHAISSAECMDASYADGEFACKLLELIHRYGTDELIERAEAASKLY